MSIILYMYKDWLENDEITIITLVSRVFWQAWLNLFLRYFEIYHNHKIY